MIEIKITDADLMAAAQSGADEFVDLIIDRTRQGIGGELTADNMSRMSANQITLIGYATLRDELMDGGFVQLIHNGYGPFFFRNPFDMAIRQWGLVDLCRLMRRAKKPYQRTKDRLESELSDEEFMALYEQMPEWEDFDDEFVSNEEEWTASVAHYVDEHLEEFITIEK